MSKHNKILSRHDNLVYRYYIFHFEIDFKKNKKIKNRMSKVKSQKSKVKVTLRSCTVKDSDNSQMTSSGQYPVNVLLVG